MKRSARSIAIGLCVGLLAFMLPNSAAFASDTTLTVDCSSAIRAATHCASGSLYGVTETKPADIANLVAPLNLHVLNNPAEAGTGKQQMVGAAIPVAQRLTGTTAKVSIRLADIYPGWYSYTNQTDWLNKVSDFIDQKLASGINNYYGYEIWNEPGGTWKSTYGNFESDLWLPTYKLIRQKDSSEPIIGPSYAYYSHDTMLSFLTFCKANNCVPDIVCWHEGDPGPIGAHMEDVRAIETSLGITKTRLAINEYCSSNHNLEGCPGSLAQFMGVFERHSLDFGNITWWFTAYPGRLGSLLATDTQPGGGWWFMNWYGQMSGNMVKTTPSVAEGTGLDGCASVNSNGRTVMVLFGGNNGAANVTIKNLPSFIGSTASVKVECAPWSSKDTPVSNTSLISQGNYTVSNGSITINTANMNSNNGYRMIITPGSSDEIQSGHVYKLENQNSARVLGITNMSTANGSTATQWEDNGTTDHNWLFTKLSDGYYTIKNVNSGLLLGVSNMSTANGAQVVQWSDSGTADHEWSLKQISGRIYKVVNKNSGKVLGVSNMTCASGASIVQWDDNASVDHNWYFEFVS